MCFVGYFHRCTCGHMGHPDHRFTAAADGFPQRDLCRLCGCVGYEPAEWLGINDPRVHSEPGYVSVAKLRAEYAHELAASGPMGTG